MKKVIYAMRSVGLAMILIAIISSLAATVIADPVYTPWVGVDEETQKGSSSGAQPLSGEDGTEATQDETTTGSTDGAQPSDQETPTDGAQPSAGEEATATGTSTAETEGKTQKKKGCGSTVSLCGIGIYFMLAGAACIATKAGRRKRV